MIVERSVLFYSEGNCTVCDDLKNVDSILQISL